VYDFVPSISSCLRLNRALCAQEVDLYREAWEEVMYNVIKVADLVKHFGAACQRNGLCNEATFPPDFVGIIKALET
jgi:hypothetical protein